MSIKFYFQFRQNVYNMKSTLLGVNPKTFEKHVDKYI